MIIHSQHLKCSLMSYYRFKRQYICVDECFSGFYERADVLVDTKGSIFEIEIKTSRADLNAEKKKEKHQINEQGLKKIEIGNGANYFYLCVPSELIEYAKKWIDEINPKYGLFEFRTDRYKKEMEKWGKIYRWNEMLLNIKRAKILHNNYNKRLVESIHDRLSSALVNSYITNIELANENIKLSPKIQEQKDDKNLLSE